MSEAPTTLLDPVARYLIVNADDFGASSGVNRGIIECHVHGVVTSASLMVTGRACDEAVGVSREHPRLAVGLHFDVWGEDEREFDTHDIPATRDEFHRQLDRFATLTGRLPTHVDSHRHAHREPHLVEHFRRWAEPLGVVLRDTGPVRFVGGFYAQWEWKVTNLDYVSVPFLDRILREEVAPGVTELSCHPGYMTPDYRSVYAGEREAEIATLTDPAIRRTLHQLGIRLISFADYGRIVAGPGHSCRPPS
jgi:chitin disaccharide deacetylase